MSSQTKRQATYLTRYGTDYSLSSLLGLSTSVVIVLFMIVLSSIQLAGLNFNAVGTGNSLFTGDPSVFYMAIFLVSATMLLVVQHHFHLKSEETKQKEKYPFD